MSAKTIYVDDLTGDEVDENAAARGVVVTVKLGDTVTEGKPLDLTPVNYEALVALANGDPDGVRAVFAPATVTRRSKTEIDHIRTVARENGYDVKDTGRLPRTVIEWFENEYQEAEANKPEAPETVVGEDDSTGEQASPTQRARRK